MASHRLLLLSLAFLAISTAHTKAIKQINISVLELSSPIHGLPVLAPPASNHNITALLENAGCKTFASILESSGVLKFLQPLFNIGLTLFAPTDEAFKAKGVPDLSKLTYSQQLSLVEYHALNSYKTKNSLKNFNSFLPTLATKGTGKFGLTVKTSGDNVTLDTGVDSARLTSTVLDDPPLAIFAIDKVLLPEELFGKSTTPTPVTEAPAPAAKSPSRASPAAAEAPAPATKSPSKSSHASADAPAPATESPSKSSHATAEAPAPATKSPSKSSHATAEAPAPATESSLASPAAALKANDAVSNKGVSLLVSAIAASLVLC